jgi:hypothetical protein
MKLTKLTNRPTGEFDAAGFLETLKSRGIILAAGPDGRIRFDAPAGAFLPELQAQAAEHRDEIIRLLTAGAVADGSGDPAAPRDGAPVIDPRNVAAVPTQAGSVAIPGDAAHGSAAAPGGDPSTGDGSPR